MEAPNQSGNNPQEPSLYRRIGGYDVIAAVVTDLFSSMAADPRLARFSSGRSADSRNRSRQLTIDQLCALTGGPCAYIGRDMKTSHAGLRITEEEWKITIGLTAAALAKSRVREKEKDGFLDIFESLRSEIVESG